MSLKTKLHWCKDFGFNEEALLVFWNHSNMSCLMVLVN